MLVFALVPALLTASIADDGFDQAVAKYQSMDLEGALDGFSALTAPQNPPEERARAFMWLGVTQADMGRFEQTEQNFVKALVLDPGLTLPPDMSPKVTELFEAARAAAAEVEPEPPPVEPPPAEEAAAPDEAAGLGAASLLLFGGVGVGAVAVIAAVAAVASWGGAVGLYQAAVGADQAGAALSMYTVAQVFAWTGNGMLGLSAVLLVGAGALGTAWFVLSE